METQITVVYGNLITYYSTTTKQKASRLNYAGYLTRLAPADRRDYARSVLVDLTGDQDYNRSAMLLNVLGFQLNQLVSMPDPNSPVQYRLILGYDYQPCFQPEGLSP